MRRSVLASALTSVLLASGLAACAGGPKADAQYVEQPVETLYNDAAKLLDSGRWTEAATAFDEVERQHPFSSWARRSTLMGAYARYRLNEYEAAIEAAQRFISLHPGNDSAAYAYYLIALSYFEQILDVGRDQNTTVQALQALQEVTRRFPDSEYGRDALFKAQMTHDQLAGKEMEIGRYYLTKDQHLAAVNRFLRVIETPEFQTTTHAPEALHRLVEAYLSLGLIVEAQKTAAVLGYNYPESEWYARTYKIMTADNLPVPKFGRPEKLAQAALEAEKSRSGRKGRKGDRLKPPEDGAPTDVERQSNVPLDEN